MSEKINFLSKLPSLIKEGPSLIYDEDLIWDHMLLWHDQFLIKLIEVAKRDHPEWSGSELHKCARYSLLNYLSGAPGNLREGTLLFYALREWLVAGNMDTAQNLAREHLKGMTVDSFNKYVIDQMSPLAKIAIRVADGPKQKALNYKDRDKTIVEEFNNFSTGASKSIVQRRLMAKHDISLRTLQRILKKNKSVI